MPVTNPPKPLTATPAPSLSWRDGDTPVSNDFDDIYFSADGGLAETGDVFFKGCDLPNAWQNKPVFTIGELGFGTGLNFLAALDLWARAGNSEGFLHYISIEAMPLSRKQLERALAKWPQFRAAAKALIAKWPGRVRGLHRLHFGNVTLTLVHEEAEPALEALDMQVHAWFLDGFSPQKNPSMWSDAVFQGLAKTSHPGAALASYTVAGAVRRGLAAAGFTTAKKPGFGRKRERLEAHYPGKAINKSRAPSPVIIGAGIAGASIARAYLSRGIIPTIIDPTPDLRGAASGNPLALIMPRLDLQDRPESRFFLSAFLYAINTYTASNAVLSTGITQHPSDDKLAKRFQKLLRQSALPSGHMTGNADGDIIFPSALGIDPKAVIAKWTRGAHRISAMASKIKGGNIYDQSGNVLAAGQPIHICAGQNVEKLVKIDVRYTEGQIDWHEDAHNPGAMHIYSGYVAPLGRGLLLGATHAHVDKNHIAKITTDNTAKNIKDYETRFGQNLIKEGWQSRASIRVTTRDTLPICENLMPDLYVLSGLGSRGFSLAPLLAEAQVSDVLGEPSPLSIAAQRRFKSERT